MTFNPEDFLSLANEIFNGTGYENARYRTTVSRAYYAAHLISKKIFEEMGKKFEIKNPKDEGIVHQMVIYALIRVNEPTAIVLKNLRKIRNKADYDLDYNFKKKDVIMLIGQAKDVINVMTNYKMERIEKDLGRKLTNLEYENLVNRTIEDASRWAKEQSIIEGRRRK
jgi:uncharacterized protein (UPF0332 family)